MDVIGARLAALRAEDAQLSQRRAALEATALAEVAKVDQISLAFLADYLRSVEAQQAIWASLQDDLRERAERMEEELATAFAASKTTELITDRALRAERSDKESAEAARLEEANRILSALKKSRVLA